MGDIKALEVFSGGDRYALDLALIREIVYSPSILRLPQPFGSLIGISVWGAEEVPVHDLKLALGVANQSSAGELVVIAVNSKHNGLLVERTGDIKQLSEADKITVGDVMTEGRGHVRSAFRLSEGIIYLLEADVLLGINLQPGNISALMK